MNFHKTALLKALSWRFFGFLGTLFTAYIVTKNISTVLGIGVLDAVLKIGVYYLHERVWHRISPYDNV